MVEAKDVSKAFGDRVLLKNFSTRILRGDRVAIVGPNGAGKTTLVKVLLGQIPADAGEVTLGTNLEVAYIDQARAALMPEMTLREVLLPAGGDQVLVRGEPRHVVSYAKDFLFTEGQLRQPVRSLSGGERNRLLLARALANPANVLVLDEPTNDLDMDTLDLLEDLLADYEGTLILVSHDRDFIDRLATSTIGLDGTGRAIETPGGWQDFIAQNPGFFTRLPVAAYAPARAPPRRPRRRRPGRPAAKLSYKDQRRLAELETLIAEAPGKDRGAWRPGWPTRASMAATRTSFQQISQNLDALRASWSRRRRNGWGWRNAGRLWAPDAEFRRQVSCGYLSDRCFTGI